MEHILNLNCNRLVINLEIVEKKQNVVNIRFNFLKNPIEGINVK